MSFIPALALSYSGLTALCFAMDKRHNETFVIKQDPLVALALRLIGAFLLLGSLLMFAAAEKHIGIIEWIGVLGISGIMLIVLLAYRPRLAGALGCVAAPLAILSAIMSSNW